jgi:hypothetical protein
MSSRCGDSNLGHEAFDLRVSKSSSYNNPENIQEGDFSSKELDIHNG